MMKKLREKKGFTLAELLIVVAIIAVLVAVSIPIFTSRLEKSREATDVANFRAAKAAAVAAFLSEDDETLNNLAGSVIYDAQNGVLSNSLTGDGYGRGTATDAGTEYEAYQPGTSYVGGHIAVSFDAENNQITIYWENCDAEDADIVIIDGTDVFTN